MYFKTAHWALLVIQFFAAGEGILLYPHILKNVTFVPPSEGFKAIQLPFKVKFYNRSSAILNVSQEMHKHDF